MHAVLGFTPCEHFVCGILVSTWPCSRRRLLSLLLTRMEFDEATAARAVLYPHGLSDDPVFSVAVHFESVFLAAVVIASFYHARSGQWLLAGLFAALGGLARSRA